MEEVLYNIEIHRNEGNYMGKLFSGFDGVKEFKNNQIEDLLREIVHDMQDSLEEETFTRSIGSDILEYIEEIK
jgi:transcriptional regulator NrdR family protein